MVPDEGFVISISRALVGEANHREVAIAATKVKAINTLESLLKFTKSPLHVS